MPDTVDATIFDRITAWLAAFSPALEVAWPGVPFKPPAGTYVEPLFLPNSNVNRGVSNTSATEHRGLLQLSVIAPAGQGELAAREIAGKIATHFERGAPIYASGFKIAIEGRPTVGPAIQGPDRIRVPITVRYSAFA